MKIHTLKKATIEKFLGRIKSRDSKIYGPEMDEVLKEILVKADEFVPSDAGAILLDDPHVKYENIDTPHLNLLHFVACFGPGSEKLLGVSMPVTDGVAGKTYLSGRPYLSEETSTDAIFYRDVDRRLGSKTQSILCVPIVIGRSVCGVIELLNRKGGRSFNPEEMKLLEIFAGYTSTLIQNALDAKRNEELTRRDDLTGLYNDRYFNQQLTEDLRRAKRRGENIALLFLDLDNFKRVNDSYGHLVGSRTLAEVGALLRDTMWGDNARIVRYGGDEFAVILPGKGVSEAVLVAEKVRSAIERAVFLKQKGPGGEPAYRIAGVITCSIGVSSFFEDSLEGRTIEKGKISFIRHADKAMYLAKENGKNRVCVGDDCGPA